MKNNTTVTHEQIAAKAYSLYLADGRRNGRDQHHWHEAERLLGVTKAEPAHKQEQPAPHLYEADRHIHPANPRQQPFARDERGSPGREEIRRENSANRPAPRQSSRSQRSARQAN